MPKLLDITGQRFGQLVALELTRLHGRTAWLCRCDCGAEKVIRSSALTSGNSTSCKLPGRHTQKAVVDFPIYGPFIDRELARERGYKWYVIASPCKRGHACERQTVNTRCRECGAEKNVANCRRWYNEKGRDQVIEQAKAWVRNNPDKRREVSRNYGRRVLADPIKNAERNRQRREGNRYELRRLRYQQDKNFRVLMGLKGRVTSALKLQSASKAYRTAELLGMSVPKFKSWIATQFTESMSWDNYGYSTWHLDHIRPCASFDLTDPAQQLLCFNWRNQRPLQASLNMTKSDVWSEAMERDWVAGMRSLGWQGDLFTVFASSKLAA